MARRRGPVEIYVVLDPDGAPRYVGASGNPTAQIRQYFSRARSTTPKARRDRLQYTNMGQWLRELDQRPPIEVVEPDMRPADASKRQRAWIAELNRRGYFLENEYPRALDAARLPDDYPAAADPRAWRELLKQRP